MKKSLHQLHSKNSQLRVLSFHGKEAPFTLKKRNKEKLFAYYGVGMSPPPLGISQSLQNSLISQKDENLAPCSVLVLSAIHTSGPFLSLFRLFKFCANQA